MNEKILAVVRVRGTTGVAHEVAESMRFLGLTRVNHCVVVPNEKGVKGMIDSAKDYITWGTIDDAMLTKMIVSKGKLPGDKKITDAYVKEKKFGSIAEFAKKVAAGEAKIVDIGMKKVFRLHPPRKGHSSIKLKYPRGALGNRGAEIDLLINRMI